MPGRRAVHPFVEAGPSFHTRHNPAPSEPSQIGGTVGAGAEIRAGRFRVSPTIRYTRWQYDGDYPRIATKRDQIELVTGISYARSLPWKVGGKRLRFGLVGGTPFTSGLEQVSPPERMQELQGYIGGLTAEVELSRRWYRNRLQGAQSRSRAPVYALGCGLPSLVHGIGYGAKPGGVPGVIYVLIVVGASRC
jgi:hypothetical protein